MSEAVQSLERLHQHFSQNSEVATDLAHITQGCLFFALKKHDSKGGAARSCWWLWGQLEFYAQPLLRQLDALFSAGPLSVKRRWAWLRNYRYNGSAYAREALQRGAGLVVVDQRRSADARLIRVQDVRQAFFKFAREHRLRNRATVIGVTGSCGKTTTKEFVAQLLATRYQVVATEGSFNTFEGVCLTLLNIKPSTDYVVLEISSSGKNDVEEKARIACPDIGVITIIGKAHLLGFGGVEGVRQVKRKLFDVVMERNGQLVVNQDDSDIVALAGDYPRVLRFGRNLAHGVSGHALADRTPLTLVWRASGIQDRIANTHLFGAYNVSNLLAAITIALECGVPAENINAVLENYNPGNMRSQIVKCDGNVTVILDAYNANPTSVQVALRDFCTMVPGHRTLILGDMLELGAHSHTEHKRVLDDIRGMQLDTVYLIGQEFGKLKRDSSIHWFSDVEDLVSYLRQHPLTDTSVLIKGSRGMALEKVLVVWPEHGAQQCEVMH